MKDSHFFQDEATWTVSLLTFLYFLIQVVNLDTHKLRQCSNFLWFMDMSLGCTYSWKTCRRTKKKTKRVWLAPWSSNGIVYHVLFLFLFWYVWKELINNNIPSIIHTMESGEVECCKWNDLFKKNNNFTTNRCHYYCFILHLLKNSLYKVVSSRRLSTVSYAIFSYQCYEM